MTPTAVQTAPMPEKADIISAQEFNLWCAMNSKPFALVQHIWPDQAIEWDVELFPGQPDATIAYGTGQRDEHQAVIAAFAFLAGVEWAEVVFRSEVERAESDEDEDLAGSVAAHFHSHAQAEHAAHDIAAAAAALEDEPASAFPMPTYVIDPDAGTGSALEAEAALRAVVLPEEDAAFEDDDDALDGDEEDGEIDAHPFLAESLSAPVVSPQAEGLRPSAEYLLPSTGLLQPPQPKTDDEHDEGLLAQNARNLEVVLKNFGVRGEIMEVRPGPVVTLYELEPAPGTKSSRVTNLADDIARSMSAITARIAVVPGRSVIGIELPNPKREKVFLREMLTAEAYSRADAKLPLVLGKDIGGGPVVVDLARMPHLLIAGTTGSGKSVGINAMILSLLYRLPPDKCRFIMVDPKMLELSVYDDIPHLLTPVVTDPKKAVVAMKWAVREMETRYRAMSNLGVRNIEGYNARIEEIIRLGEKITRRVQIGFDKSTREPLYEDQEVEPKTLPYIVVVVDEMADLMLVAGKEIEAAIQRLAQMARAAGIHLIMATQRPSVDVITGTIKANFPTRISFQVTSKIDSRTILGEAGAEQLLGQGDMLYMAGGGRITRVHGPFVADDEVEEVVRFIKVQGETNYIHSITEDDSDLGSDEPEPNEPASAGGSGDDLYDQAIQLVLRERKVSVSFIQRYLQIGYNRSARLVERMEAEGIVSAANHAGKREILGGRSDSGY